MGRRFVLSSRLVVVFSRLLGHLLTLDRIELGLADAEHFRSDFDAFVFVDEGDAFFQSHAAVRRELNHVVRTCSTHVREVLALRDVHGDIDVAVVFAHDHARINFGTRTNDEVATVFELGESVACGFARFLSDEHSVDTCRDFALVRLVFLEEGLRHGITLGEGEELRTDTDEATGRDDEFQLHSVIVVGRHVDHFALALLDFLDAGAAEFARNFDLEVFDRFKELAVFVVLENHLRRTDGEFIKFTAHVFNENREVQNTTARDLERRCAFCLFDEEGGVCHVGAFQTFLELVTRHELSTILASERGGIHSEEHGDCRRVDVDTRQVLRIACSAERITNVEVVKACDEDDFARTGFFDRLRGEAFVAEDLLRADGLDGAIRECLGVSLVWLEHALLYASHSQTAEEAGVFERCNLEERFAVRVALRSRDAFNDLVHQDAEVAIRVFKFGAANALTATTEHLVEVELFFRCIEFAEQVKDLVQGEERVAAVAVDLVHDDDRGKTELQSLLRHKAGLGHRAFECVNHQDNAIDSAQNAFHLATEVSMPRGIDDVHAVSLVHHARVLGEDGNAAFAFEVVGVHHSVHDFFTFMEGSALFEELVHQGRFTVVNVGDDGNVSDF